MPYKKGMNNDRNEDQVNGKKSGSNRRKKRSNSATRSRDGEFSSSNSNSNAAVLIPNKSPVGKGSKTLKGTKLARKTRTGKGCALLEKANLREQANLALENNFDDQVRASVNRSEDLEFNTDQEDNVDSDNESLVDEEVVEPLGRNLINSEAILPIDQVDSDDEVISFNLKQVDRQQCRDDTQSEIDFDQLTSNPAFQC